MWIVLLGLFPLHISKISSFHRFALNLKSYKEQQPIHLLSSTLPCRRPTVTATQVSLVNTEKQHSAEMSLTVISGVALQNSTFTTYTEETYTGKARHGLPHQSIRMCFS